MNRFSFSVLIQCFIFINQLTKLQSIQCYRGNRTFMEELNDCPGNFCFKLVIENSLNNKTSEERGCTADLVVFFGLKNSVDENGSMIGSSNDQCSKLGEPGKEMILCKCTTNLCNSSLKLNIFSYSLFISFSIYFIS